MMHRRLGGQGPIGGALVLLSAVASVAAAQRATGAKSTTPASARTQQAPKFEVDPMWPKPMSNRWILGSVTGLAVDSRDHVWVINLTDSFTARTETGANANPPIGECCFPSPNVIEYDASGAVVGSWGGPGQGYDWPEKNHGLGIDPEGNVWIGGAGGSDSRILKFARDGKFIAQFGKGPTVAAAPAAAAATDTTYTGFSTGRAAGGGRGGRGGRGGGRASTPALPANSGSTESFGGPAAFSFDADAKEVFVADGYRNHRVAVLDMTTGAVKRFWGAYGNKPDDADTAKYSPGGTPAKQFGSPVLCATLSNDGMVYVCDTQNDRIQVFKKDGSFVKEKVIAPKTLGMGSVWNVAFSRDPQQKHLYVADGMNMRVHILDRQSLEELTSFGDGGRQPGQFYAVHSVATDSKGNLYTSETYEGKRVQKFNYKGIAATTAANKGVLWPAKAKP